MQRDAESASAIPLGMAAFGGDVACALSGTKRSRRSLSAHYETRERVNKEGRFPNRPFGNGDLAAFAKATASQGDRSLEAQLQFHLASDDEPSYE